MILIDATIESLPGITKYQWRYVSKKALVNFIKTRPNDNLPHALRLLRGATAQDTAVINALTQLIHEGRYVASAAHTLSIIQPENSWAVEALLRSVNSADSEEPGSKNPGIKEQALDAIALVLAEIAPEDERILPILVRFAQENYDLNRLEI